MRRWLCFLIVAACAPPAATTTTTLTPSTSREANNTSSVTTTSGATITTVLTASGLPFIVSPAGLIGYFDGAHWVSSSLESPVEGGETYQVIDLDGIVGESVGSEAVICEPAGTPLIELNPPLLVTHEGPGEIAVAGANWNLTPRAVETASEAPSDLIAEGVSFIEDRGLSDPEPNVAQYLTFDLDGDGSTEEALVLNRLSGGLIGNANSYSLVIMRKRLDVEVEPLIVAYSQGVADNAYVVSYFVSAIADLSGDGKMELVLDSHYYEGNGTSVHEYIDDDIGLLEVLASGCGA